jgi:hypothetical protein
MSAEGVHYGALTYNAPTFGIASALQVQLNRGSDQLQFGFSPNLIATGPVSIPGTGLRLPELLCMQDQMPAAMNAELCNATSSNTLSTSAASWSP